LFRTTLDSYKKHFRPYFDRFRK
jgi:hypothetical protein